jgi:ABC-2 type transport system permease protein
VLGLGVLGLLQTIFWAGVAYFVAQLGLVQVPLGDLGIDWRLAVLLVVYFILSYGVYSSLMAGIGALFATSKESGPATILVVIPAIVPLMFLGNLVDEPHSTLSVVLSLFPLTAPISMMVRLVQGSVPAWQIATSILLMALTTPLLLGLVARLFRAQILLGSGPFSLRRAWAAIRA